MAAYKFYTQYALKTDDGSYYLESFIDRAAINALYFADGDKLSSSNFMTGTTPEAAPLIPLIGAPAERRLLKVIPTPPPIRESWSAELITRPKCHS